MKGSVDIKLIEERRWSIIDRVFMMAKKKGIDVSSPKFSEKDGRLVIEFS